ncbi:MAG: hemerythrin domain-containing protein [Burkholderiaceae bacterium]
MTLFEHIHESHEIQRALCRQVTATRSDVARRQLLFLQLKVELEAHAAAEERYLYVPLLMTDPGLSSSRHALSEHHEIEELCDDLSVADKSGDAWLQTAKDLSHLVRHHLKEEETKFFKVAGRILSDAQKALMARRYAKDVVRMRKKYSAEYMSVGVGGDGKVQPASRVAR